MPEEQTKPKSMNWNELRSTVAKDNKAVYPNETARMIVLGDGPVVQVPNQRGFIDWHVPLADGRFLVLTRFSLAEFLEQVPDPRPGMNLTVRSDGQGRDRRLRVIL